jgi:hypothetical protein
MATTAGYRHHCSPAVCGSAAFEFKPIFKNALAGKKAQKLNAWVEKVYLPIKFRLMSQAFFLVISLI